MGQAIPRQHPAVVLRSRYTQLRMLLAVAMIAVVGLTVAVVILAGEHGTRTTATSTAADRSDSARPEFRMPLHGIAPVPDLGRLRLPNGERHDGGPEEGTRGPAKSSPAPGIRHDGGPDEGSRGLAR